MTKKNKNGFTLVEILAVVVILGILLVIAMPSYTAVFNSLKRTAYLNKVKALNLAAKDYLSNTAVRDEVKNTTSSKPNWCKTIKVSDLPFIDNVKIDTDVDAQTAEISWDVSNSTIASSYLIDWWVE